MTRYLLHDTKTGEYLAEYNPDYRPDEVPPGTPDWLCGLAIWTADPNAAMHFETVNAAFDCWRTRSIKYPTRPDGHPNRPLTFFTVGITPYERSNA